MSCLSQWTKYFQTEETCCTKIKDETGKESGVPELTSFFLFPLRVATCDISDIGIPPNIVSGLHAMRELVV